MNKFKDYYEILGVSFSASSDEIKKAYRECVKKFHPDLYSGSSVELRERFSELFRLVQEAYEILSDDTTRAIYNLDYIAMEEKKEAQKREQRKQKTSSTEDKKGFLSSFVRDYRDILKEEKKQGGYLKRHRKLDDALVARYGDEGVLFQLRRGAVHISYDVLEQMSKFSHITTDSIPKYTIRNRRFIEGVVAMMIISNLFGKPKTDVPVIDPNVISETTYADEITTTLRLNRVYQVKAGDTLSDIADDNDISVSELVRINDIENKNLIRPGQSLIIPYTISSDDLEYMTTSCDIAEGASLEAFATSHETDVQTLQLLNPEAIIVENDQYIVLSDSIMVPEFMSRKELQEKKEQVSMEKNIQKVYKK